MNSHLYLRIIAGQFGGRNIEGPPKEAKGTRPTLERVRESLFDIIARKLLKARVLDLCAGTGALGFEALSRGAASVTFVESLRQNIQLIQKNIETLNVADRAIVVAGELPYSLGRIKGEFDVIFFDPPYTSDLPHRTIPRLFVKGMLSQNGILIVERDRRSPELKVKEFNVYRRHRIGDAELWFFERSATKKPAEDDDDEEEKAPKKSDGDE